MDFVIIWEITDIETIARARGVREAARASLASAFLLVDFVSRSYTGMRRMESAGGSSSGSDIWTEP